MKFFTKLRLRSSFRWKFFKKSIVELYSELITFRHFKKFFQNKKVPLYIWHHKIRYNWPNFELQVPFFSWDFLFNDITWRWLRKICGCAIQAQLAMETAGLQPPPNNFVFSLIGITSKIWKRNLLLHWIFIEKFMQFPHLMSQLNALLLKCQRNNFVLWVKYSDFCRHETAKVVVQLAA